MDSPELMTVKTSNQFLLTVFMCSMLVIAGCSSIPFSQDTSAPKTSPAPAQPSSSPVSTTAQGSNTSEPTPTPTPDPDLDDDGWPNDRDPSPELADPPVVQRLYPDLTTSYRDPFYTLLTADGEYSDVELAFLAALNATDERTQGRAIKSINERGNITRDDVYLLRLLANSSGPLREEFADFGFGDRDGDSMPDTVEMALRHSNIRMPLVSHVSLYHPESANHEAAAHVRNLTADGELSNSDRRYLIRIRKYRSAYFRQQIDPRYYPSNVTRDGRVSEDEWSHIEDQDDDLLLDETEERIGTSTTKRDTDGDGFIDVVEHFGMETSDPTTPDVYVEVDTTSDGHMLERTEETLVEIYREAGASNTSIRLHVIRSETDLPPREEWSPKALSDYESRYHETKRCGTHYFLVIGAKPIDHPDRDDPLGFASPGSGLYTNPWDEASAPEGQWMVEVELAAHELGHAMGIGSYAHDNEIPADAYPSTMNYNYGVYDEDGFKGINRVYSDGSVGDRDRNDWAIMSNSKFGSRALFMQRLDNPSNNCPN